jgi:hypothetical protein
MTTDLARRVSELAAVYANVGLTADMGIFPSVEQWRALLEDPHQGKIYLVTFYKFCSSLSGQEIAAITSGTNPADAVLARLATQTESTEIFSGWIMCTWIGKSSEEIWDMVSAYAFKSCEALIEFYTDPELVIHQRTRPNIIERQRSIILRPQ